MILQMMRNICVRLVDMYKQKLATRSTREMYHKRLKFCTIYLALNRGCFEAILPLELQELNTLLILQQHIQKKLNNQDIKFSITSLLYSVMSRTQIVHRHYKCQSWQLQFYAHTYFAQSQEYVPNDAQITFGALMIQIFSSLILAVCWIHSI